MTAEEKTMNDGTEVVEEKKAAAKKPAAKKPAAKKTAAKKPAAKKSASAASAEKKPAAKKAAAKKPVAKKPVAKKPVAKKPAAKKQKVDSVEEALAEVEKAVAKKPTAKKAAQKARKGQMLRITQVRSQIGFAGAQREVLAGLGLGRIGRTVVRIDDPCIRGMVTKVSHLVSVEEVEA